MLTLLHSLWLRLVPSRYRSFLLLWHAKGDLAPTLGQLLAQLLDGFALRGVRQVQDAAVEVFRVQQLLGAPGTLELFEAHVEHVGEGFDLDWKGGMELETSVIVF